MENIDPKEPVTPKGGKPSTDKGVVINESSNPNESFYINNAKLAYYKEKLSEKLRAKNPQAFDNFISEVGKARRANPATAGDFIQGSSYDYSLNPDEVKAALGSEFPDFVKTMAAVRGTNRTIKPVEGYEQRQNLAGEKEAPGSLMSELMFGKRFATMPIVRGVSATNKKADGSMEIIDDEYVYNPKTKSVTKYRTSRKA